MKVKLSRRFVLGSVLLLIVLGGRLLYMCDAKKGEPGNLILSDHNGQESGGESSGLSARELRLRAYAQHLMDSGRCQDYETARRAAEAMEAMRNLLGR